MTMRFWLVMGLAGCAQPEPPHDGCFDDDDDDGDGVCDVFDDCEGFDDGADADRDGIPDACESKYGSGTWTFIWISLGITGQATVGPPGPSASYAGQEVFTVRNEWSDQAVCTYAYQLADWDSDPAAKGLNPITTPCTDTDANPCLFAFTTSITSQTATGQCEDWVAFAAPHEGIGYMPDFQSQGTSKGPALMTYDADAGSWEAQFVGATFSAPNFQYVIPTHRIDGYYVDTL